MYIEAKTRRIGSAVPRAGAQATGGTGRGEFAALLTGRRPLRSPSMRAAGAVEGLLSLQAGEEAVSPATRRRARKGLAILETLDEVRADRLAGGEGRDALDALAGQLHALGGPGMDAGLERVMAALELRVRVELAKDETARASHTRDGTDWRMPAMDAPTGRR